MLGRNMVMRALQNSLKGANKSKLILPSSIANKGLRIQSKSDVTKAVQEDYSIS